MVSQFDRFRPSRRALFYSDARWAVRRGFARLPEFISGVLFLLMAFLAAPLIAVLFMR